MAAQDDDWRLQGQEAYLQGVTLRWSDWVLQRPDWDHDHCEFCFAKFTDRDWPDVLHSGYVTSDRQRWICEKCFNDFAERFQWKVV